MQTRSPHHPSDMMERSHTTHLQSSLGWFASQHLSHRCYRDNYVMKVQTRARWLLWWLKGKKKPGAKQCNKGDAGGPQSESDPFLSHLSCLGGTPIWVWYVLTLRSHLPCLWPQTTQGQIWTRLRSMDHWHSLGIKYLLAGLVIFFLLIKWRFLSLDFYEHVNALLCSQSPEWSFFHSSLLELTRL